MAPVMNKHMENESAKRGGEETGKHENSSDANGSSVDTESITTSSVKTETTSREGQPPFYEQTSKRGGGHLPEKLSR